MTDRSDRRRRARALAWQIVAQASEIVSTLNELQIADLDPADQAWMTSASASLYSSWLEVQQLVDIMASGDLRPLRAA